MPVEIAAQRGRRRDRRHRRRPDMAATLSSSGSGARFRRIHWSASASRPADELLLRALRRGELDFVVAEIPSADGQREFETLTLTSDRLGVCCRRDHPLTRRRRVSMSDLLQYPWIKPPHESAHTGGSIRCSSPMICRRRRCA